MKIMNKKQFEKKYGKDWRKKLGISWNEAMLEYAGKVLNHIQEKELKEMGSIIIGDSENGIFIFNERMVKK